MGEAGEHTEGLDEPVRLSDWNPAWPAQATALRRLIAAALGKGARVEHIGSTAVVGLCAKPVLDLMVGACDAAQQDAFAERLSTLGLEDMGEAGVPGRRHLRARTTEHVNVHIVVWGSIHWVNNLAIRDFLKAHPAERSAYAQLKRAIVAAGADRLLAYSDQKGAFMAGLLSRARRWDGEGR